MPVQTRVHDSYRWKFGLAIGFLGGVPHVSLDSAFRLALDGPKTQSNGVCIWHDRLPIIAHRGGHSVNLRTLFRKGGWATDHPWPELANFSRLRYEFGDDFRDQGRKRETKPSRRTRERSGASWKEGVGAEALTTDKPVTENQHQSRLSIHRHSVYQGSPVQATRLKNILKNISCSTG